MGPLDVTDRTREGLIGFTEDGGEFRWESAAQAEASKARVSELLQLIVATREYQFA
jgi:hypothetical protein